MTAIASRKLEAFALIAAVHRETGINSAALIAELLAISERYALRIMTDQGLHQPRPKMTAAEALEACGESLAHRLELFRNGTRREHGNDFAA